MLRIFKKITKILSKKQKIQLYLLFLMMLIGALMESLGIGLLIPLLTVIMQPEKLLENSYASRFYMWLNLKTPEAFIYTIILFLILIFIFKNMYLYLEYYLQYRFVYNLRFQTQKKLLNSYLHRPYEFYLDSNSSEIIRVLTDDTDKAFQLLSSLLNLFTEGFISIILVLTIIVMNPVMAIMISMTLGIIMFASSRIMGPVLKKASYSYLSNTASANKWILQSISGIKEVKIDRKEEFFLQQYAFYGKQSADSLRKERLFGNIPRLVLETGSICTMMGMILIFLISGREMTGMIPQLSAFAMAAVRLLPSTNRISTSWNQLSYLEPMLDKIIEVLESVSFFKDNDIIRKNTQNNNNASDITLNRNCTLEDVTYSYPGASSYVLKNAEMEIPVGQTVGIIGVSGAGKTTVVDLLLGLLKPSGGNICVDGKDIHEKYIQWLSHIGYIPQTIYLLDDTIRANVAFGYADEKIQENRLWNALKEAQLDEFVKELPEGINTSIGERGVKLSGGQRQRIGIARALYTNPDVLVFDEATSALDNETESAIMESINLLHGKKTMVIIAHRLKTLDGCDMIYRVENGRIYKEKG